MAAQQGHADNDEALLLAMGEPRVPTDEPFLSFVSFVPFVEPHIPPQRPHTPPPDISDAAEEQR